ncbi:MAG: hypothetical protein GY699_06045, partial [Desulfobacteraceae bacterium]|nr:hypothetical protein [Desulfobacteraceae bacterium]
MARQWRIEFKGAYYHVMSRGIDGRDIAASIEDKQLFISVIEEMADRFETKIHAWVLMSNHYHLLIETPKPNLSKSMQWFGATFTRRYNVKHRRWGHLFQGRFKSLLIQDDTYLFRLSCYIHQNPLRAKLVTRLAEYPWGSYRAYAYGDPSPEWLSTDLILSLMDKKNPHKAYRDSVQTYAGEKKKISEDIHLGIAVGTREFATQIKTRFLPDQPHDEIPQQKPSKTDYDIPKLLKSASHILKCDIKAFKDAARIQKSDKINRDLLVYMLWRTGAFTNKEIGKYLGITYSSVSYCVKSSKTMMKKNIEFKKGYKKLYSLFKM